MMQMIDIIADYRHQFACFNANPLEDDDALDAMAAETFGPPLQRILAWDRPAASADEAIAALRLADDACRDGLYDITEAMVRVARGYFEQALSASAG